MFRTNDPLIKIFNGVVVDLPTPANISIIWNWGSLLGLTLIIQIIRGILLATRFSALAEYRFESVVIIFQESNYGWLLRLVHSTGASFFFLFLYIHIGRGLYYGRYRNKKVWNIGLVIYLLLIGTAFLGYVLPWGQMSYWAATVIAILLFVGRSIVQWVDLEWGRPIDYLRSIVCFCLISTSSRIENRKKKDTIALFMGHEPFCCCFICCMWFTSE